MSQLYTRHSPVMLGLALRIVRERREAEDLLHDVFLEICEGEEACIYAARALNGISIAGAPARPPKK